jgi:NAD(P)-dependent dehydrogenase (short-subunit alcohol dehydrogenase family)
VAVVTGAGSGIGRGVARRLAAEGARVAAFDISAVAVADTVAGIVADGGTGVAYACDVTSESSVTDSMASVVADLGPPRVVCNVAGIGGFFNTADMPFDRWQQILAVNLNGPFLVCRAALPHLLEHGGSIVNVASNTALMGQAYSAAYCASKAGLLMFTKALAAEYLGTGVRANVVAPGGTDTPLLGSFGLPEGADPRQLTKIMTPLGFSTPAEIAASIAFLASDESSYTTGAVLSVDGGLTI